MLLAVDVGNSQTVIGLSDGAELVEHWRVSTVMERTPDELALQLDGLMGVGGLSLRRDVDGMVVCSVVPVVTEMLRVMARKYLRARPIVVGPGTRTGMALDVDNPREVGADRLVNALAAYERFGGPGIVVDFGTALSFDVFSAAGAFVGGAIAPGLSTAVSALSTRGAQLPRIELARPHQAIGRRTVEAMRSGAVYGFAGMVERIVAEISRELEATPTVVATGGLAPSVIEACRSIQRHEPLLTLEGLRLVWSRNA